MNAQRTIGVLLAVCTLTVADIRMEFAGGTGFDPPTDQHAHDVEIRSPDADHVEVECRFQQGDRPTGSKRMVLARVPAG